MEELDLNNVIKYKWSTEYYHYDNSFTMSDFLENHLPISYEVIINDGSYSEVQHISTDEIFSLDAKGDGDSYNHIVNIKKIC